MSFIKFDFPREVLEVSEGGKHGGRYIVRDYGELERYWKGKNGGSNAYFSTYGYRRTLPPKHHKIDSNSAIVRHFVMDFDCKDFRSGNGVEFEFMQKQVKRLHEHLMLNDYHHYIWFSGGGFHVWVPISEMFLPTNGPETMRIKSAIRGLQKNWHDTMSLPCNDPAVAGNLNGMIRIPNSYNLKRGCWSIPVSEEELTNLDYEELIELAQEPRSGYIEYGTKPLTLKLPEKKNITFRKKRKVGDLPTITLGSIKVLPCLAQAALGPGNPIHRARFHLASYLADRLRWFFPVESVTEEDKERHVEQIVQICSEQGWVDWSEEITRGQVKSIVYKGYAHARCETLIQEGLCIGKCMYWDGTGEDYF